MRLKLLSGAAVVVAIGAFAFAAWALIYQTDSTTGRVEVSDFLTVSPESDWIVIPAGADDSGLPSILTLTNPNAFNVALDQWQITHDNPLLLEHVIFEWDDGNAGCIEPLANSDPLDVSPQFIPITSGLVPAGGTLEICGRMLYDGSLTTNEVDNISFELTDHKN